jgi:hypothetical protein
MMIVGIEDPSTTGGCGTMEGAATTTPAPGRMLMTNDSVSRQRPRRRTRRTALQPAGQERRAPSRIRSAVPCADADDGAAILDHHFEGSHPSDAVRDAAAAAVAVSGLACDVLTMNKTEGSEEDASACRPPLSNCASTRSRCEPKQVQGKNLGRSISSWLRSVGRWKTSSERVSQPRKDTDFASQKDLFATSSASLRIQRHTDPCEAGTTTMATTAALRQD